MAHYDHGSAFRDAFGVTAEWFLEKAERDLAAFRSSGDATARTDALINFAATMMSLEEWLCPSRQKRIRDEWKKSHRTTSPEHAMCALIALVAKHEHIDSFQKIRLDYFDGFRAYTEDPTPQGVVDAIRTYFPDAQVQVRAEIDDDLIVGYWIRADVEGLRVAGDPIPLDVVMERALGHWRRVSSDGSQK